MPWLEVVLGSRGLCSAGRLLGSNPELTEMKEEKIKEIYVSENLLPIEDDTLSIEKNGETKTNFRIRSKKFFMTYPRLPEIDNLGDLALESLKNSFGIIDDSTWGYLLSVEKHKDGTPHLHIYLKFNTVQGVYSRDKLSLNIKVNDSIKKFEGKYEAVKNHHHVIQYVMKASENFDNIKTNMILPIFDGIYYSDPAEHVYAVLRSLGLEAANEVFMKQYGDLVVNKGSMILKNLEVAAEYFVRMENKKKVLIRSLGEFKNVPDEIIDWVNRDPNKRYTLILYGPPGTGKTELAKSIMSELGLNYVLIRNINILKGMALNHAVGLIFDDFNLGDFNREEIIHILDIENPSSIRILYGTADIPSHMAKIFTTNRIKQFDLNDEAIRRRIIPVEIKEKLWETEETITVTKTVKTRLISNSTATVGATVPQGTTFNPVDFVENKIIDIEINDKKNNKIKKKRGRPKGSVKKEN
jgi:hypothetical protein